MKSYNIHTAINLMKKILLGSVLTLLFSFITHDTLATEYLRVYTSPPKIMTSTVTGGTVLVEDFTNFTNIPNSSWAPLPNGYSSTVGTYTQTDGQSYIKNDDQYGAGTGKYMSIKSDGEVRLVFDNPVRYFAFAWPAGDGKNNIKIIRDGQVIGTFETADVIALIPNSSHRITAINGDKYRTSNYYGKPNTGQNNGEPYAFLHYVASEGLAFDEIIFSMGTGGEFENDNHTLLLGVPELQGEWVELISIETPTANNDSGSGTPGNPVIIDVLANDVPGDAALNSTTVQIAGTTSIGDPLVVANEGTWTVNPTSGAITFTPEAGFIGSPTAIEYSVLDVDNYASNLATVTVTYPTGPTANDDNVITAINTPVDINILANDIAGSTAINPASVTFIGGTEPDPTTEGLFSVNATSGLVTFTPVSGFTGIATIDYQICDQYPLCDIATITVTIVAGTTNLFPAAGFGTLAFEDLWPGKGDYDFNDLVLDYQFEITTTTSNYVESVKATFIIRAIGATLENGFGFQLASVIDPADLTVTGYSLNENIITLNGNGTEAEQTISTIIVFDNAYQEMAHPGSGIGINTTEGAPYVTPVTLTINIVFTPNTYTFSELDISNFNPFIFVNKDRSVEVHLADYPPTALMNVSLFGTANDDSDPALGKYYKTANNLPWAVNIYESFDYPIEKQEITWAYLKFAQWAESNGTSFTDWYKNLDGYRNDALIYTSPGK